MDESLRSELNGAVHQLYGTMLTAQRNLQSYIEHSLEYIPDSDIQEIYLNPLFINYVSDFLANDVVRGDVGALKRVVLPGIKDDLQRAGHNLRRKLYNLPYGVKSEAEAARSVASEQLSAAFALVSNVEDVLHRSEVVEAQPRPPQQRPSPISFGVDGDKIVVTLEPHQATTKTQAATDVAARMLKRQLDKVVTELSNSNVDRRLGDEVAELREEMAEGNVVGLGIIDIRIQAIRGALDPEELSGPMAGILDALHESVVMYTRQFPDWLEFSEQASALAVTPELVTHTTEVAETLVHELSRNQALVDPQVPETIKHLLEWRSDQGMASKRLFFGLVRVLENIVAAGYGLLSEIGKKTATRAGDVVSAAAATALAAAIAGAAIGLTHTKLPETDWVKPIIKEIATRLSR